MNLDFLIPLLSDTDFKIVDYASQMDFVGNSQESRELPAVFFHLFKTRVVEDDLLDATHQQSEVMIAFKVVAKNSLLESARLSLMDKLQGYSPTGIDATRFEYMGGEVVDVDKSVIWWREVYKTTVMIEKDWV